MDKVENTLEEQGQRRREFLTKSAKVAVTVPAVSLLMSHSNTVNAGIFTPAVSGACLDGSRPNDNDLCPGNL